MTPDARESSRNGARLGPYLAARVKGLRGMDFHEEMAEIIAEAAAHGIELTEDDFYDAGDCLSIDGTEAREWLDAMIAE